LAQGCLRKSAFSLSAPRAVPQDEMGASGAGFCQTTTHARVHGIDPGDNKLEAQPGPLQAPCCLSSRLAGGSVDRGERFIIREGAAATGGDEVQINDLFPYLPEARIDIGLGVLGMHSANLSGTKLGRRGPPQAMNWHGMDVIYECDDEAVESARASADVHSGLGSDLDALGAGIAATDTVTRGLQRRLEPFEERAHTLLAEKAHAVTEFSPFARKRLAPLAAELCELEAPRCAQAVELEVMQHTLHTRQAEPCSCDNRCIRSVPVARHDGSHSGGGQDCAANRLRAVCPGGAPTVADGVEKGLDNPLPGEVMRVEERNHGTSFARHHGSSHKSRDPVEVSLFPQLTAPTRTEIGEAGLHAAQPPL